MVGSVEDFLRARAMLEEERQALLEQGYPVSEGLRIGAMIEIPSMALCADALAAVADFASIGSNDLTQYLLAVDRTEATVAGYCQKIPPCRLACRSHGGAGIYGGGQTHQHLRRAGRRPHGCPGAGGCGDAKIIHERGRSRSGEGNAVRMQHVGVPGAAGVCMRGGLCR